MSLGYIWDYKIFPTDYELCEFLNTIEMKEWRFTGRNNYSVKIVYLRLKEKGE